LNDATDDRTAARGTPLRHRLGVAVRALLVFGGIAPFVPAWTESMPGLSALGSALDAWFSLQCHREAERSVVGSAVCTRCLGIYVGLALGALVLRPRLAPRRHVVWMFVAAAALVADVLTEALGWRAPNAPLRFVTGLGLAYPAAVSIVGALRARTRSPATAP
jgi:uncharacterized membrane protein